MAEYEQREFRADDLPLVTAFLTITSTADVVDWTARFLDEAQKRRYSRILSLHREDMTARGLTGDVEQCAMFIATGTGTFNGECQTPYVSVTFEQDHCAYGIYFCYDVEGTVTQIVGTNPSTHETVDMRALN